MSDDQLLRPQFEHRIDDLEALKVYFDPLRKRIMNEMAQHPRTIHEIADLLGVPFTRLYYHINLLEKHGFIRVVETRRLAGAVEEKYYQITAYTFVIDRALTSVDTPEGQQGLEAILNFVFDAAKDDVRRSARDHAIDMDVYAPHPRALLARRGTLLLTEAQAVEVYQRLLDLLTEVRAVDVPEGVPRFNYTLALGFFPASEGLDPDAGMEG